jgi:hypothetical protein
MPTEFLTDDQEQAYGHYLGPPSTQQLSLFSTTIRFLGTFLAKPADVPADVVAHVAAQLGIRDVTCLRDYAARPATAWEHAAEIRRIYGYADFTDPAEAFAWCAGCTPAPG